VIYFDFWKLTSGSNFGGVIFVGFLRWSKCFLGIFKKFGGAKEMLGGVRRKTLIKLC